MVRRTFVVLSLLYAAASIAMALVAVFAVGEWYSVQERALAAMRKAVEAGYEGRLAGRIPRRLYAEASTPREVHKGVG